MDSNPERVSTVKKMLRWSIFRCEVRGGCAARTGSAKRFRPFQRAKEKTKPSGFVFLVFTRKFTGLEPLTHSLDGFEK